MNKRKGTVVTGHAAIVAPIEGKVHKGSSHKLSHKPINYSKRHIRNITNMRLLHHGCNAV